MKKPLYYIILPLFFCYISCCHASRTDEQSQDIDIKIHRFDKQLWALGNSTDSTSFKGFIKNNNRFFPIYYNGILRLGKNDTIYNFNRLQEFLSDSTVYSLYNDTEIAFPETSGLEQELTKAFTLYKSYFPESTIPEIYTHVSGLNQSIIIGDSLLSISLDNYLGKEYPLYKEVFYDYQLKQKEKNRIAIDAIEALLYTEFPQKEEKSQTLLDDIVHEGKIIYTLQKIFPDISMELLLGYTTQEYSWLEKNESTIWARILSQKHLFSTDQLIRNKYISPAPFTSTLTNESPGRTGRWVGWQIIASYMKKNSQITLQELLTDTSKNGTDILKLSGYKG